MPLVTLHRWKIDDVLMPTDAHGYRLWILFSRAHYHAVRDAVTDEIVERAARRRGNGWGVVNRSSCRE